MHRFSTYIMNVTIPNELTPGDRYTKQAKNEISAQAISFVEDVCKEAERYETLHTDNIEDIQVTTTSIKQAVNYVRNYGTPRKSSRFIEYWCPALMTIITLVLAIIPNVGCTNIWVYAGLAFVYLIMLTIQMTNKLSKK